MSIPAAKLLVLVGTDTTQMVSGLDDATNRFANFADRTSRVGSAMTLGVTLPLIGIGTAAVKATADFDTNLNILGAVSQATGAEMDALGEKAIELGKDMTLPGTSAADAAEAMLEMSKAGLSVKNTLAGAKGVLQLSAAGALSNAAAAEIASNALNMFSLAGEETTRVADLLAAAANASSAEVVDIADSLKMAGAVANSAGLSIDELVTMIGLMANAGIKGSDSGTSLKQMLLSLQAPTDKAKELMQELGISVYDESGQMLGARDIIGQFNSALGGLTQEQRNAALATIFGSDAVRAANIVMMGGVQAFDDMEQAVTRQGAAAELAGARNKGLAGAFDAVGSSLETASLAAVKPFQEDIENLALGIADAANAFSDLDPEAQKAIVTIPLVAAATGPALTGVGNLATGVIGLAVGLSKIPILVGEAIAGLQLLQGGATIAQVASLGGGAAAAAVLPVAAVAASWGTMITMMVSTGKRAAENNKQVTDAIKQHSQDMASTSLGNWQSYASEMTRSLQAANLVVKESDGVLAVYQRNSSGALHDVTAQYGLLTEAQLITASSARTESDGIMASNYAMQQYYATLGSTTTAHYALSQASEASKQALASWQQLQQQVAATEAEYLTNTGDKMVQLYGSKLPEGTQKYREGLGAIDAVFKTNHLGAYDNEQAMIALIGQYERTGDLETFQASMQKLADEGVNKATAELETAAAKAEELYANLMKLPTDMTLNIHMNVDGLPDFSGFGLPPLPGPNPAVPKVQSGSGNYVPVDIYEPQADGGPVYKGKPYWVGEEGPEPYFPAQNGRILSVEEAQAAMAGNSGQQIVYQQPITVIIGRIDSEENADRYAWETVKEIRRRQ